MAQPRPGPLGGVTPDAECPQKSWFSPAKISLTDSSSKTLRIVSARIRPTESTLILVGGALGAAGSCR